MAYLSCVDHYVRFEELASGRGYVDILFLPRKGSQKPALVIELKWDKSVKGAITQIQDRDYGLLARRLGCGKDLLLVGINYSTKTRKHTCRIEQLKINNL